MGAVPPAPSGSAQQTGAQAAALMLLQGAALMAVITVYAQISWVSANAAQAARKQINEMVEQAGLNAAAAGADDVFRAWRAVGALASAQLIAEAQNLPSLASYNVRGSLPAVVLAQQLLQDGSQADALVALNGAPHPLFMPTSGQWLQPV
jgi:prophage DNA circulation protein